MHLKNSTNDQYIDDYIEHVAQLQPDIILYGGDMIESRRISEKRMKTFDEKLLALEPVNGKFILSGNHNNFNLNGYNVGLDLFLLAIRLSRYQIRFT
ncbi:MAG: metallophosphoesterase [Bacteroidales bacterium]